MTKVALAKWGNNLALRLPKSAVSELGVEEGTEVALQVKKGELIARPLRKRPSLAAMCAKINDKNRHVATDWGSAVGREVW
jgi:antitoxin component of MazEF toxin-antitoxin module